MSQLTSSVLGYPRIGENREWKKALESFWKGDLEEAAFLETLQAIRLNNLQLQQDKGISLIPVNDFTLYDQMLDTSTMFGIVPARFEYAGGPVPVNTYYAIARGTQQAQASEMTKWFNTNYHYIVPELKDAKPALTENRPLAAYREAKQKLGIEGKPVIIGLYTFLKLSKGYEAKELPELAEKFIPLYGQVLRELEQEGVQWVQIDEPILVTTLSEEELQLVHSIYTQLREAAPGLNILLQTYFDAVDHYEAVAALPVQAIGLDFVHGLEQNVSSLEQYGFPQDKLLGAGVVDGRNIWRSDYKQKLELIEKIALIVPKERIIVQSSSSLLHVPVTAKHETALPAELRETLAFAEEKLEEVVWLSTAAANADSANEASLAQELKLNGERIYNLSASPARNRKAADAAAIAAHPSVRQKPFAERQKLHQEKWQLPFLPTTTIGSFPQTTDVRSARQKWRKNELSSESYASFINEKIKKWIEIQEELNIDVLVHGEFERTDMVEFFGEKLDGFAFTRNGWVQSYGSRCVKPPVIYGDVVFIEPMTVTESVYAQSLTSRPVKGMLTGPITILNWSFPRNDITREQVAYQIALALSEEVKALEAAGIEMIQVDEPALREGLPLKRSDWDAYLKWGVHAFKLSTSDVRDTTQIHTHMCYCEFHDIIDSILALDADVISIETSRSHGELIHSFEEHTYDQGIGLGVYDIHSPRVPAVDEMVRNIERALRVLDPGIFWINPDCGLKTRGEAETVAALRNMMEATYQVRKQLGAPVAVQ
ncbi:5-methyltetrahydropteroyltriglutamate--homocysteine S-methyltransferase [Paenibacillus alkaliterrae]|uniref:5-methyltetrahydropteroyltriglutamate-- homocysteine S-methyltransferase n=1 Tax=Paenibacillus alkaliterrae TaxID=320909 RepID=UPI001F1FA402|nr:5-methyltetrahydropteroyltriglutamate--homocysteine S-methyltransferase [Paenibacillus alkaliterrae]MCF2939656.1 5-methyltetrahydropteroyltriglutamate--homocysteine S-methyltransferase [Paenibacillus alkaliterrae]